MNSDSKTTQTNPYDFSKISDWDSHRPMVIWALQKIDKGTVIELGAGHGSTPVFMRLCKEQNRNFESYEANLEWAVTMLEQYSIPVTAVESYDDVIKFRCALLFIDNAPGERRKVDLEGWANEAQVIIVHDTELSSDYVYGLKEPLSKFKYRCTLKNSRGLPETTAVSNTFDVTKWKRTRVADFWFE